MGTVELVAAIDEAALELDRDGDQTYEVDIASAADALPRDAGGTDVTTQVREAFGTWVEVIHSYRGGGGSAYDRAVAAHESIRSAVSDWRSGGRSDLAGWAARCRSQIERVDTAWMERRGQSWSATSRPADASSSLTTAKDIPEP